MSVKIEKGIPIPSRKRPPEEKYPFSKLQVGDSFLMPVSMHSASAFAYARARAAGITITLRRVSPKQTRVWRIF